MTRTFACLAAALALLSFTGCGDPPNSGVAVAANTGPLKPLPPLPEDQNAKITPPPLVPSALPAIEAPAGSQQPAGQSTTGPSVTESPAAAPTIGNPAITPPSATAPATPPANGGGLLQSLFGDNSAAKTPTPNGSGSSPNAAPSSGAAQIALSGAEFLRVNRGKIRFAVNYVFVQGEPKPTNSYTVVVRERGNVGGDSQHADVKFEGKDLRHSGKFEGEVNIGGRSPSFDLHVIEGSSREGNGHQISDVVEAAIRRDLGRPSGNAAPDDAPPAADPSTAAPAPAAAPPASAPSNGGGGLLDSLFGNKPTEKTAPPSNTPAAPNNGSNNAPSNPQNNPPGTGASNVPADNANEIALSGVTVGRNQGGQVHFLAAYVFTRGQPLASNWYTVVVQQKAGRGPATPAGEMKIDGSKLQQRGDLEGNVTMGGSGRDFEVRIMEGTSRDDKGRLISNVGLGEIHHVVNGQDIGHPEERAAPGVGAQGKDYGPGLVTTPISAYFAAKQLIVFTIQIPNAMKFFKASNNRDPSSQDEFMEKIIKDNGITLPDLPAGERYIYDPQAGELMVEHPKK
jgi:hypothetical protein